MSEWETNHNELKAAIEALIFVSQEPIAAKQLAEILGDVDAKQVEALADELMAEFNARAGGVEIRQIAGGYRFSTRPQFHEQIRRYIRTQPSARLSIASLETLAVIAYKQPITLPEIQEIRGKSSVSSVKTLLEKRLIVPKGRKLVAGRPIIYGTSKDFLIQFGLSDLSELPSIEDFEDLVTD
ncbi:MAG: SMC-Scp complex subunit ScpB [Acidobacteria bacterium]|nr:SMC-Scp complex subunit ScpB [Acidobacteriota bacterium]